MPEYANSPAGIVLQAFIAFCERAEQPTFQDLLNYHEQQKHERAQAFIFSTQLIALAHRIFSKDAQAFFTTYLDILQQMQKLRNQREPIQVAAQNFLLSVNRAARVGVYGTSFAALQAVKAAFTAQPALELQVNLSLSGALEVDYIDKIEQFRALSSEFFLVPEGVLVQQSDVVITGAECIFKNGALCRPGSLQLAICCQYFKKPLIIIAETSKMCDFSICSQSEAMKKYYQMVNAKSGEFCHFVPCISTQHQCLLDSYDFVDFHMISKVVTDVGVMSGAECQDYICQLFLKQ